MKRIVLFVILALFSVNFTVAQEEQVTRRWFAILHDLSAPFEFRDRATNQRLYETLGSLFENQIPLKNNANTILLSNERENGIEFFDPERDNISLFYFGLKESDKHTIDKNEVYSKNELYESFVKKFFHLSVQDWQTWTKNDGNTSFNEYFFGFKSLRPAWGNGYSLSEFAFPEVLKVMPKLYADEIIVIILSDYLAGSTFGNKQDEEILRQSVFQRNKRGARDIIQSHNWIKGNFYTIDYFDYGFRTSEIDDVGNPIIHGIKSFKVKPLAGSSTLDNANIGIDSEISLEQLGFLKEKYELNPSIIKFPHNDKFRVERIEVSIQSAHNTLYKSDIADVDDETGHLLTNDDRTLEIDSAKHNYLLPKFKVEIPQLTNEASLSTINPVIVFSFFGKYDTGLNSVPMIYKVNRSLNAQAFSFDNDNLYKFLTQWLPVILIIIIILSLIFLGKPIGIEFRIEPLSNSYEKIDFRGAGRIKTPYATMEDPTLNLRIELWCNYKQNRLGWRIPLFIRLEANHSKNVDVYLKINEDDGEQFVPQNTTHKIRASKAIAEKPLKFYVEVKKNDPLKPITEPTFTSFNLKASFDIKRLFFKAKKAAQEKYAFHIGPELSSVWIGLDPGTTGTCIAAGNHYSDIVIEQNKDGNDLIVPSLIAFDIMQDLTGSDWKNLDPLTLYLGDDVEPRLDLSGHTIFRSIKKLLGYKDSKKLTFKNSESLSLNGSQITYLLVDKVLSKFVDHVESTPEKFNDLLEESKLKLSNAVVAIPNNFTASKTQAMVDSIQELDKFQEIRVLPEAEAVMIYYLFNRPRLLGKVFENEQALIFDMGGATINASIIYAYAYRVGEESQYTINVEAKLGYSVGGDSIDYCLVQFLYGLLSKYEKLPSTELNLLDQPSEIAIRLSKIAEELKIELVQGFQSNERIPITGSVIYDYIDRLSRLLFETNVNFNLSPKISDELEAAFAREGEDSFLSNYILSKIIYQNVTTAVKDILTNYKGQIDTIIYSGRSTLFPGIKERVREVVKSHSPEFTEVFLEPNELKSAVAKGCTLYGMNNNAIEINNLRTNGHFGYVKTIDAGIQNFQELIKMGESFNGSDGITKATKEQSSFGLDANQVRFYQVMGVNPQQILEKQEKHKYSVLAKIKLNSRTDSVGISVSQDDQVTCRVRDANEKLLEQLAVVSDEEIKDANDEHYTWLL